MTTEQLLATLKDLATKLSPGYIDRKIEANMKRDKDIFVQFQKDQLAAGLSSLEKQLTPSYLTDSFFKTTKRARQYAKYKQDKAKKPTIRYGKPVGFTPATGDTPNLYITGQYYKGLTVTKVAFANGKADIEIGNVDAKLGNIADKYGREVLGVSKKLLEFYHEWYTRLLLEDEFNELL